MVSEIKGDLRKQNPESIKYDTISTHIGVELSLILEHSAGVREFLLTWSGFTTELGPGIL